MIESRQDEVFYVFDVYGRYQTKFTAKLLIKFKTGDRYSVDSYAVRYQGKYYRAFPHQNDGYAVVPIVSEEVRRV